MKKINKIQSEMPVTDDSVTENKPKSKKKVAIIAIIASLCVIGGLSWFLLYGLPEKEENPMFDPNKQEEIIGMYR